MVAKEITQVETSVNLTEQSGLDVGEGIVESSRMCTEVQDGIFDMEDLGEEKGTKTHLTDEEPSVRIIYSSLPRSSKKKLEELLNCWSEWHSCNFSSEKDPVEPVVYGEETYFPAIPVGLAKFSTVSFQMDNQVRKRQRTESSTLINDSAPLYDRDYSLGLTPDGGSIDEKSALDLRDASRCFNCGSYNHSLKECPKPHNNAAVSNARKEYQSKKNKNSSPHLRTRYYQNTPGGKYDGLKPGCLAAETRELLGLKDLQPPPWLNRMRKLGYPPGYLDLEENDQPSGIAIFGDEGANDDGGNEPKTSQGPEKKMTVEFPGINASIPDNADPKDWEELQGPPASVPGKIFNHLPAPTNNWHGHDWRWTQSYVRPPSLHHSYEPPLLNFNQPNNADPKDREEVLAPPGTEFSCPPPDKIFNHLPAPTNNSHGHDQQWTQSYVKAPSLHYSYESPPLLNFNRQNNYHNLSPSYSSEPFSPGGIPIPRSPGYITRHFSSGTPPSPRDYLPQNHNIRPNSVMYQSSWHSPV